MEVLRGVLSPPPYLGGDFYGVLPLTNNTAKTSVGEDLVKILPAVAEQSCPKKKKHCTPLNYKTSGAV